MNAVITNPTQEFQAAMVAAGLPAPDTINDDGATHRFSGKGRAGNKNGWYFLHTDGIPWGEAGDWAVNGGDPLCHWCAKSEMAMTQAERDKYRAQQAITKAQREAEQEERHMQAAAMAEKLWAAATPCTAHPYLQRKGVQAHGVKVIAAGTARAMDDSLSRVLFGMLLVIPMRNSAGSLRSLQFVTADGVKRLLTGGQKRGCYFAMGKPKDNRLMVVEGFATGASVQECTGDAVAVAFDCGNLCAVAASLAEKHPDLTIVIGADDDSQTDGNPGMTAAKAAAQAVKGLVAVPDFGSNRPDDATDFNDLHQIGGAGAVQACFAVALGTGGDVDEWLELQSLIAKLDANEYPTESLPTAVRYAVLEVAGFVKAPIPLIAVSALAALSLGIQAHVDVRRAVRLTGPSGLFLLAIADSGERKTTCDSFFMSAIRAYEAAEQEAAKPLITAHRSEHEAWEAQRNGLKEKIRMLAKEGKPVSLQVETLRKLDDNEPIPPRIPRLIYGDATPEALAFDLSKKWPSGGVISSEAGVVFGGHGMGADSVMRNLAMLNQFWDGVPVSTSRRTTESFTTHGARLTMALQVQESTIRAFIANTKGLARGTGFLARFLVAWPESTQGTRYFTEAPKDWPALTVFNNRLSSILNMSAPIDETGVLAPAMLSLAPDAMAVWVAFHDSIESMLTRSGELYEVRDVASKTADNAARLAALFHTFEGNVGPIGIDAMQSACSIAAWHLSEARRFLSELALTPEQANPARLEVWILDYCKRERVDKVSTRDVQQFGPAGLRDKQAIQQALQELTELGRMRLVIEGRRKLIQVNPALLVGGIT